MRLHQTAHARNWAGASGHYTPGSLDTLSGGRSTRHSKLLWQDLMKMAWSDLATIEMGRTPETTEAVSADPVPTPMVATAADLAAAVPVPLPAPLALPAPLPALVPVPARVAPSSSPIRSAVWTLPHRGSA